MSLTIAGLGTAVPPDFLTPDDGIRIARIMSGPEVREANWLSAVYAKSGVQRRAQVVGGQVKRDILAGTRESGSAFLPTSANEGVGPTTGERMAVYAAEAGPMALRAAEAALDEAGFQPNTFTHLITVSCTGFLAPGVDLALIHGLGLPLTIERTHVGFMGCHGALNGLRVANAFVSADPTARVLLCAVELCSLHYHYGNDPGQLVANAIFADGAAAVVGCGKQAVVGSENPSHAWLISNNGKETPRVKEADASVWQVAGTGSCVIPDSADAMGWAVGDHGFEMTLARSVPSLIARHLRPWLEGWLQGLGLSQGAIGSWAVHPGGPKILAAVEEGLGLPASALAASRGVYADFGNMSSPTVLFVVDRLRKAKAPGPCVALGFGPGLVAEATLLTCLSAPAHLNGCLPT